MDISFDYNDSSDDNSNSSVIYVGSDDLPDIWAESTTLVDDYGCVN